MNAIDATVPSRGLNPRGGFAPRYDLQRRRLAARPAAQRKAAPRPIASRSVRAGEPRRYRAEAARRSRAWVGLTIAIVAGALMMAAAYMSASGLQSQAWEKEQTATSAPLPPQEQYVAPASSGGGYVTEPAATIQP